MYPFMSEIAVTQRLDDLEHDMKMSRLWTARSSGLLSGAWRMLVIPWVRAGYTRQAPQRPSVHRETVSRSDAA